MITPVDLTNRSHGFLIAVGFVNITVLNNLMKKNDYALIHAHLSSIFMIEESVETEIILWYSIFVRMV